MNTLHEIDPSVLLNTLRILYVEDDPDALQELSRFLRKRVSALNVAANGSEALVLCGSQKFDVIISDLRMPEMDGLTFIRLLREAGIHTPVIITSAFSDSETILKAVDLGIVKYCVKPISTDELLAALCRIAAEGLTDSDGLMLPRNRLLDRQQRLDAEKSLKSGFAFQLKSMTGKGPREVHVLLSSGGVEIWVTDVMTVLEHTLMQNAGNLNLVAYIRKVLYTGSRKEIETMVSQTLTVTAALEDIKISPSENTDRLIFSIR